MNIFERPRSRRPSSLVVGAPWLAALVGVAVSLAAAPATAEAAPGDREGAAGQAGPARFALVIGTNDTLDAKQQPLRFADDDAARISELMTQLGADVELVTEFDRDSQRRFPDHIGDAVRPTKKGLDEAHARLVRAMKQAKHDGRAVEFVIYYSGHGDVGPDGQGYLTLAGGDRLTRQDLFSGLLKQSPADHNHVIIDACRSETFVLSRGEYKDDRASADYARGVREYLDRNHLGAFPQTGVVIASSADQQTHEWERFQGGVFTHEVISGLRGAADLNGDGAIEYSELGAFVAAANSGVSDSRAHLEVAVRAPAADERAPIIVHENIAEQRVLLFSGAGSARLSIEDDRGVRIADLHKDARQPSYVRLPDAGDVFVFREQRAGKGSSWQEARVPDSRRGPVLARKLEYRDSPRTARGPLDQAFRDGLFAVPYGQGYYAGYTDREDVLAVQEPDWEVKVWKRVDGELVEVTTISGSGGESVEIAVDEDREPEGPKADIEAQDEDDWKGEDDDDLEWPSHAWGAMSVGSEFTPFAAEGTIQLNPSRITANQFAGMSQTGGARALRGFDVRWWGFAAKNPRHYPRAEGYFRSGYTQGVADFLPAPHDQGQFVTGDPTRLDYFTVPLFLGGNLYAFRKIPVRPFVGAGFGLDVLSLTFARHDRQRLRDVSARIGFELHAGIDIRITNWFGIVGEIRQLWSARRRIDFIPDFSNEGFTVVTSMKVGFPLHRKGKEAAKRSRSRPRSRPAQEPAQTKPVTPPVPVATPAPEPQPSDAVASPAAEGDALGAETETAPDDVALPESDAGEESPVEVQRPGGDAESQSDDSPDSAR